jgi:glucuronokinase
LLPKVYVAYRDEFSEPTEVFHNNIRQRFDRGEPKVVNAMRYWAELTDKVKHCLLNGQINKIGPLLNAGFDKRRQIYKIGDDNIRMVETARSTGASATFTGSGGAIVGSYEDDAMFKELRKRLGQLNITVIKPKIVSPEKRSEA